METSDFDFCRWHVLFVDLFVFPHSWIFRDLGWFVAFILSMIASVNWERVIKVVKRGLSGIFSMQTIPDHHKILVTQSIKETFTVLEVTHWQRTFSYNLCPKSQWSQQMLRAHFLKEKPVFCSQFQCPWTVLNSSFGNSEISCGFNYPATSFPPVAGGN